jgi:predicted TIM-barrel fold metal-dependent hydrolase
LQRDTEHARRFLTEFQDRLMFARDYFDGALMEFLKGLSLPPEVLGKLMSGNAIRLLREYPSGG